MSQLASVEPPPSTQSAAHLLPGEPVRPGSTPNLTRVLTALLVFGAAFGYVEAAVVVYLRALYEPMHQRLHPHRAPDDLFPVIRLDQLRAEGPQPMRWLAVELAREAATLAMLAAAALAVARNFRQWFAAFLFVFGIWDIFFYVFLKVLLDWPPSLATWDLLFLLPVPWVGPVAAPVLVALAMVGSGTVVWWREARGRPLRLRGGHWAAVVVGGVILVLAFCWDYRNILAGGFPNPFPWPLFAGGLGVAGVSFVHAWRTSR